MKSPANTSTVTDFIPLLAIGTIILLCIAIVASYIHYSSIPSITILPGGVTYTGK